MFLLPNDILDVIYCFKHNLEMKDICKSIEEYHHAKVNRAIFLLKIMFDNDYYYLYNPEYILNILTALRNEDYITDICLFNKIEDIKRTILSYFNFYDNDIMIFDPDYYMENRCISLNNSTLLW